MAVTVSPNTLNPIQQLLLEDKLPLIESATGILSLLEVTRDIIGDLLQRQADEPHRAKTQKAATQYFMATMNAFGTPASEKLKNLKVFATEIVTIVIADRHFICEPDPNGGAALPVEEASAEIGRRQADHDQTAPMKIEPTRLAAIEGLADDESDLPEQAKATSIATISPPEPQTGNDFQSLFSAAICYRVARVACFFQRYNPKVNRGLTRPFLLTAAFADRLYGVIREIIVPQMLANSRNITLIGTQHQWVGVTSVEFWDVVDNNERFSTAIMAAWSAAWQTAISRRLNKTDADGKQVAALVAPPILLEIRKRLVPRAGEYSLPTVGDNEIKLFTSMLTEIDLERIEYTWQRLRQLYEQELDPRVYQDKARDGALRDSILNAFGMVPDFTGDFLAILCYFCFPNCDLNFLERFTHNKGVTVQARTKRIPFLMHFLSSDGVANAQRKEAAARQEREAEHGMVARKP